MNLIFKQAVLSINAAEHGASRAAAEAVLDGIESKDAIAKQEAAEFLRGQLRYCENDFHRESIEAAIAALAPAKPVSAAVKPPKED